MLSLLYFCVKKWLTNGRGSLISRFMILIRILDKITHGFHQVNSEEQQVLGFRQEIQVQRTGPCSMLFPFYTFNLTPPECAYVVKYIRLLFDDLIQVGEVMVLN